MKTPIQKRYPPELAEKLEEIKIEIIERMENPDFDFMEVEEVFQEFGVEPDYIFEVLNEII
ncbi:hypothetical protein [Chryseobacterium sp.]|uniref:hypothetical protein n=1 Tax=Chryseobacterium sp. TaxID=1871047 RepID=UPI00388EA0F0